MNEKIFIWILLGIIILSTAAIIYPNPVQKLTGYATTSTQGTERGEINVNIESNIGLEFTQKVIDWDAGKVKPGQTCLIQTDTTPNADAATCEGFQDTPNGPLVLENIGNSDLHVKLYSDVDAAGFFQPDVGETAEFKYRAVQISTPDETGACVAIDEATWQDFKTSSGSAVTLCAPLAWGDPNLGSKDSLGIHIKVGIPPSSPVGTKQALITAFGSTDPFT